MPTPTARARRHRWTLVALGTTAVVLLTLLGLPTPGTAAASTAERLLRRAAASGDVAHSGTALSTGAIGLPDLPRLSATAALLGQTTRTRSWWRDERTWRVAVLTPTGERDTYAGDGQLWTWDYADGDLSTGPAPDGARLPRADDLLPPRLVRGLLSGPDGVARAAEGARLVGARTVAGRPADGVRVRAGDRRSTLDHADLWLDRGTGLPVAVDVVDASGTLALSSRFDSLALGAPDAATLAPPPPPAGVVLATPQDLAASADAYAPWRLPGVLADLDATDPTPEDDGVVAYGSGLARLAVVPLRPHVAAEAVRAARAAGGADLERAAGGTSGGTSGGTAGADAVLLRAGALTAAVVRSDDDRRAYLVAGTVTPRVLRAAVDQLLADPPPWRYR